MEVDETYLGGLEEGATGRQLGDKALIVVAAEADGKGIGRIRLGAIQDASAGSLHPFVRDCIAAGSTVTRTAGQVTKDWIGSDTITR